MRNLKRVLSLALALVMVLGMMVMGAGAASTDFDDGAEINNAEAVDVMNAIEVITGSDDGNFYPEQILTRAEAATIICRMLMRPENAATLAGTVSTTEYTDVPVNAWYAPYVAYCSNLGIISGDGEGHFFPTGKLTGVAFGKMLLIALGYDATIEGYVNNPNYVTNILADMIDAGINIGSISMTEDLSRDDACQMALQTLEADMVYYERKGTNITMADGTTIVMGASKADEVDSDDTVDYNSKTDGVQQFCEKYFSDLTKDGSATDAFGRPATAWVYDGNEISQTAKRAVATFDGKVNAGKVVSALKGYSFNGVKLTNTDVTYTVGSDTKPLATWISDLTANGTLVEFYADKDKNITGYQPITYTLAKITNISTDNKGNVTYNISGVGAKIDYADETADQLVLHGDFARGDYVTYATTTDGDAIVHVYPVTEIVGTMTAYSSTNNTATVDGTVYTVANGMTGVTAGNFYSNSLLNKEVILYVDQYGYAVEVEAVEDAYDSYAQVKTHLAKLATTVDGATPTVEARFVLADGTVGTYDVKLTKDGTSYKLAGTVIYDNTDTSKDEESEVQAAVGSVLTADTVFAYDLDENTISLQAIATSTSTVGDDVQGDDNTVATGSTSATVDGKTVLLTSSTVYVLYDATKKSATVYEGSLPAGAALDTGTGAKVVATVNSATRATAQVVFGLTSDVAATSTGDYAYVNANDAEVIKVGNTTYNVYEAYAADGSTVTLYDEVGVDIVGGNGVYTWDEDNNVTNAYSTGVQAAAIYNVVGDQIVAGSTVYNIADAEVIYATNRVSAIDGNYCVVVLTMKDGSPTKDAATIFVVGSGS